ncbi:MAG: hypothetical protein CVU69_02340 [Deltaproteobacteria bacterium HGW-Deltaproteobacteria-4]|nr:MAG: hypothetical protein CVU69_02340 [Deltaproteobacteria bacterium HGW-Deltaproteobacteria-4]
MSSAKVSVVIPCYNAVDYVAETIQSVLSQNYGNVEIIVIDDGSSDGSWEVITSFGDSVQAVQQENRGGCAARNRGAGLATGDYLMFLDADDVLAPDALEHLVQIFDNKGGIAACPWQRLEQQGNSWVRLPSGLSATPPEGDFFLGWLSGWYLPPCALLWSRKVYEATGGWDEELAANQDGDLILRALLNGAKIHLTAKGMAWYRHHGTTRVSVSSTLGSLRAFRSRVRVLEKVTTRMKEVGIFERYAAPLGQAYHKLARNNFVTDRSLARDCLERSQQFAGTKAVVGSLSHRMLCRMMGVERKESLAVALGNWFFCKAKRRKSKQLHQLKCESK